MILINLLPHREQARKRRRDAFNVSVVLAALLGGAMAGAVFLWFQQQIDTQTGRNSVLEAENKRFDAQIKDIAGLEAEITALRARQQAVEDLQADRNTPVYLLTDLVRQLPEGTYVTSMTQKDQELTITGMAASQDRVSEFLRKLGNDSPWFAKPQLIEVVADNVRLAERDQRRVSRFNIRVKLVRSSERPAAGAAAPLAGAGSAPAAGGSAPGATARAQLAAAASQAVYGTVGKLTGASAPRPASSAASAAGGKG